MLELPHSCSHGRLTQQRSTQRLSSLYNENIEFCSAASPIDNIGTFARSVCSGLLSRFFIPQE